MGMPQGTVVECSAGDNGLVVGGRKRCSLLDTPPEEAFDRLSRLASRMLGAPISMVSVVEDDRNFFKSAYGMPDELVGASDVPIGASYCKNVYANDGLLAIEDTTASTLTALNPCNDRYDIRSYLGAPARGANGEIICTICVLDRRTRAWTDDEKAVLTDLVSILEDEIALRVEIAERRETDERNRLLMREMEHRVKNSLSTVQAIVSLSLRGLEGGDLVREEIQNRVASMSKTHSLLVGANWENVTIGDIVDNEIGHYRGEVSFLEKGRDIRLNSRDAVTLGMIVHELATNAAKYGAIARKGSLDILFDLEDDLLRLRWCETGCPGTREPASTGFGTTLVDNLVRQNRGSSVRSWNEDGLEVALSLRLVPAVDAIEPTRG